MKIKYLLVLSLLACFGAFGTAQAAPARLSQFGYFDVVFKNAGGDVNYLSETSSFSNFYYLDLSNILTSGMTQAERQQKISSVLAESRSRGLKVIINAGYYFFEPDPAYKTRPAFKLASCFDNGGVCPRWQADAPLLRSMQADILAFAVSDQPNYYLVKKTDQAAVVDKIHSAVSGTPVMASYALDGRLNADRKCVVTTAYDDVPLMWYYGKNREDCVAYDSAYGVPDNLDWLSVTVYNLGSSDLVKKYWVEPIKQINSVFPGKPVLPVVESFSDHLNHYGATMDDFQSYGISKRRADGESLGWYYDAAKNDLSGVNLLGFLYYSYGGLNLGQPARGDGAVLDKEKQIYSAQSVLPIIKSFSADPAAIMPNTSSVLSWEVSGASSISLDQNIGNVTGTSKIVNPTQTSTYTLSATNSYGTATKSLLVTVIGTEAPAEPGTASGSKGYADGTLVNDGGTIYVLENGQKRPIASMRIFNSFGYKLSNVIKADLQAVKAGDPLLHENQRHPRGSLVVYAKTVYFLGANLRYPFTSAAVFSSWGCSFKDVVSANRFDLEVPEGPPVDNKP